MGLFDVFKQKKEIMIVTEEGKIYQPIAGEVIPLVQIGDGVFSEGILGKGCGIKPVDENVYAPVDGEIIQVADTKHAIGIISKDGIEVLIHVGIDTVEMNGNGFKVKVKVGDKVRAGQILLRFSRKAIADSGYQDTTAILITNTDEYSDIILINTGYLSAGNGILQIVK